MTFGGTQGGGDVAKISEALPSLMTVDSQRFLNSLQVWKMNVRWRFYSFVLLNLKYGTKLPVVVRVSLKLVLHDDIKW